MVDKQGNAYLIDFGASKQIRANGTMTTSTALCYTPGYAPNEQIGQMYDRFGPWTDIYALGATIFNLLTNKKPPMAIDIEEDEEDAFDFPIGISGNMRKLVVWMMQPKRKERPQSVDEILDTLSTTKEQQEQYLPKQSCEETIIIDSAQNDEDTLLAICNKVDDRIDISQTVSPVIKELISNMIFVEGGTFMMGRKTKWYEDSDEEEHQVTLSSFSINKYEVTQEEWEAVMGNNPSNFIGAKLPVEQVSWDDCQIFISKLNELTGMSFRLPSEAEWEYSARGGNKNSGCVYAGSNDLNEVAWFNRNSEGKSHEIGLKLPNELGLFDMCGNIREWCQDWYGNYSVLKNKNPQGPSSGNLKVFRGGSWDSSKYYCLLSSRDRSSPNYRNPKLGLRLAL
jgi:formylglycine-generating enzyme required for sulfatase activity